MRKLVFGIIAVICVQFAFVNYMELQSPLDLAIGPVQTAAPQPVHGDLSWIEELERSAMLPVEPEGAVSTRVSDRDLKSRSEQKETPEPPMKFRPAEPQAVTPPKRPENYLPVTTDNVGADGFETVVISYNRTPELSDCEKYEAPRAKRRSFMAKAVPVAKKPWEWVKSVGSKLY